MGEILAVLSLIFALLVFYFLMEYKLSKLKIRIHTLDDVYTRKENAAAAIRVLEGTIKKLNSGYRELERRIDILESGHPDSDFDYAETDDDGNVLEIWFNGKKYVSEDKRDEDVAVFYADDRIVAEINKGRRTMGGNGKTEELLNHIEDLNYFYNVGLMSAATYRYRYEELMQNDS